MGRLERRQGEVPSPVVIPSVVLTHAADAIAAAVARRWPEQIVNIGPRLPSVTNYVTNLAVDDERFIAKYSVLGVSLVSIVRGACGPWAKIEPAQRDYVHVPHSALAKEHTQLQLLQAYTRRNDNTFQVPEVVTYEAGVLITAAADGPSLGTEILREDARVDELLTTIVHTATGFHRDPTLMGLVPAAVLDRPHTSIAGTFARKFLGPSGSAYRNGLGIGWAEPHVQRGLAATFTEVCEVLAPLRGHHPDHTVIYGDLKPEHILLGRTGQQTWLDPGLQRCDPCADIAKLISRTALVIITAQPSSTRVTAFTETLATLLTGLVTGPSRAADENMLRRLLTLWVADWANYLATGLSIPPTWDLPLPPTLVEATARSEALLQIAWATAAALVRDPAQAWETMLSGIHQLALATGLR